MKARRNEEEETTSKIVSKNVTVGYDSTLEQRVENLIVKSYSNPAPPNPINGGNNHNYGHPPSQSSSRPKRDYRRDHGHPPMDIWQNLRGPGTSAVGPYREADGSSPIQCFRCRGWDHPKRLCPSCLNYTQGGWYETIPPRHRKGDWRVPSPEPISSTIDLKISQVANKYLILIHFLDS